MWQPDSQLEDVFINIINIHEYLCKSDQNLVHCLSCQTYCVSISITCRTDSDYAKCTSANWISNNLLCTASKFNTANNCLVMLVKSASCLYLSLQEEIALINDIVKVFCILCFRQCLVNWFGCRTGRCVCRCNHRCRRCRRRCKTSSFPYIQVLYITAFYLSLFCLIRFTSNFSQKIYRYIVSWRCW